jgi:Trk-type K+ transport system membrane component
MPKTKTRIMFNRGAFLLSTLTLFIILYEYGFKTSLVTELFFHLIYLTTLILGIVSQIYRYIKSKQSVKRSIPIVDGILVFVMLFVFLTSLNFDLYAYKSHRIFLVISCLFIFIRELAAKNFKFKKNYLNPAQLFVLSFVIIIIIGALLLMLPEATTGEIVFLDALFTSTSAVSVTGLASLDTSLEFTLFGQTIIALLIQVGGIGIMTFTSYFSYFFKGGSTYESQLMMRDVTNSDKIAEVFGTLKKIILLTFLIEFIGGCFIYFSLDKAIIPSFGDRAFFSFFHAISGFCNAGFSTLSAGLYDSAFRFNYSLHLVLAFLFMIGGIGFPIMFNTFTYFKHLLHNRIIPFSRKAKVIYKPWVINLNTKIILMTTLILVIVGTISFYFFEQNNSLQDHQGLGKLLTAFFGGVTPRTAGFNSVDYSTLTTPTILITILLMWIGASPASTGGGIKTSTFALATMNIFSVARGKYRLELFKREIAEKSIMRAFAIIALSLIVIGIGTFSLVYLEPDKNITHLTFEVFSAYSTVGLSMGVTTHLGDGGKLVLILVMFIGRVSTLTLLITFVRQTKQLKYRYPSEEILIN